MLVYNTKKENVLKLTHACKCLKCSQSCKFGSGSLIDEEIPLLAQYLGLSESELKEKYLETVEKFNTKRFRPKVLRKGDLPYGQCIFYDENKGCTIHPVKPFECRIAMNCKPYGEELITWFNLNYFLNTNDPESLRQFKIYLESGGNTLPGAEFQNIFNEEILKKLNNYEDLKDNTDWDEKLGIKNGK